MNKKSFIDSSVKKIESTTKNFSSKYKKHIRLKAIKEVEKKLEDRGIEKESVSTEDFEAMVHDTSREIQSKYRKYATRGVLFYLGIDFLLG